jgi:uncharacterized alpha-E superfamily protein
MLSRVAGRIYWMSRYLERVENTARLAGVYTELMLDLPEEAGLDWSLMLQILGAEEAHQAHPGVDEFEFLLSHPDHHGSLLSSLALARENARTTRDLLPSEAWQTINELHLYARERLRALVKGQGARVPAEIVSQCHEITGILEGTMSHGPAYQFVRLGRSLERADMTTRMIDVAAAIMMAGRDDLKLYANGIWRAILRALSAFQMYRQYVRRRITGTDVVRFLLLDQQFPRSVLYCVNDLDQAAMALPRGEAARAEVAQLRDSLTHVDPETATYEDVHDHADELQLELGNLHAVIFDTWLNPMRIQ